MTPGGALTATLLLLAPAGSLAGQEVEATEPNRGGELDLRGLDPDWALSRLVPAEGFEVRLWASEREFPELANPVAMTWDGRGRLWVATMPGYPQWRPGDRDGRGRLGPDDRLLVLEDTDGDGAADSCTVFADGLHLPTGFELGDGGAYVARQPDLLFLADGDGDGRADLRRVLLHGFGTEDSHHAISAFTWGPGGGLYFQEGTFHHTQVETPRGPVRCVDAGVFRFEPRTWKLSVFVSYRFANPWGHVFDRWGQSFVADASGGANYWATAFSGHVEYPRKHAPMRELTTTRIRPTAGCEIVSSRHFPPEMQGDFLLNNCIGFHGVARFRLEEQGSGFVGEAEEPLLFSRDISFRPVDLQFGPDGALYVCDWCNPLIGHMQYSLRDPRRDRDHGRIWKVVAKDRPLLQPPRIAGAAPDALVELLAAPEDRTRYRVRRELRRGDPAAVDAALERWLEGLDPGAEGHEHRRLEALWVRQGLDRVDVPLLDAVLGSEDFRARAAGTRVLQHWWRRVPGALDRLRALAADPAPRVRLEAVRACSFVPSAAAAEAALEALRRPTDAYLEYVLRETLATLAPHWRAALERGEDLCAGNPAGLAALLERIDVAELAALPRRVPVLEALLRRDGVGAADRRDAAEELARVRGVSVVEVVAGVLGTAGLGRGAAADLAELLPARTPETLAAHRRLLQGLARDGRLAAVRVAAFAALLRCTEPRDVLALAQAPAARRDLLAAVARLESPPAALRAPVRAMLARPDGPVRGRFVRVSLPGPATLTLAEVQVWAEGRNVARGRPARQSATAWGGDAGRAVDGDVDGRYASGSSTHTPEDAADPWWEVDLGREHHLDRVVVWNRTDGDFYRRLDGYTLEVLDGERRVVLAVEGVPATREAQPHDLAALAATARRRAAIAALAALPGEEEATFEALRQALRDPALRPAAADALARRDASRWPREAAQELADELVRWAAEVPFEERTQPAFTTLVALGAELGARLPPDRAAELRQRLANLDLLVVRLRAVPHAMRYDRASFSVPAGKPVELVLENPDVMPHNLLVCAPGTLAEVGAAADAMATAPDGFAREFVPEIDAVLHATGLVDPGGEARLRFVAPESAGDHPYVCTFPGHWRTMNGTMHVVDAAGR